MTADHVLVFMENARLPLVGEFFLVFLFIFLFIALVLRIWSRRVIMLKIKVSRFRKLLLFVSNYISWIRICWEKIEDKSQNSQDGAKKYG